MDRLTARGKEGIAYFPECFKEPCLGCGCTKENCEFMTEVCEKLTKYEEAENKEWIPVAEKMPKEHDSIFAKFKGTNNWSKSMFERTSYKVIVTVKYADGTILTETAHTTDGKWKLTHPTLNGTVIAWKPFPDPYKEKQNAEKGNE